MIVTITGHEVQVDELVWYEVNHWVWWAVKYHNKYYIRGLKPGDKRTRTLHNTVLKREPGTMGKLHADHINGDTLDNRRMNLRIVTCSQNLANRGKTLSNKSGFKGVSWYKRYNKWIAQVCHKNYRYNLGYYDKAEDAARAYDKKTKELFGEFAYQNFPDEALK